jgi:hypothetical protein
MVTRFRRQRGYMSGVQISPLAGKPLEASRLIDVSRLVGAYFD